MNPTKSEKELWDLLAEKIGCIACRKLGMINHDVSIHHCEGRTKPGAHRKVLPLCSAHHQTGGEQAPSIHPWRKRFEARFGTQEQLMDECKQILADMGILT